MGLLQPHERHRGRVGPARLRAQRTRRKPAPAKAVVVHSLDQARAAVEAATALGLPLVLLSGQGAAGYAGPGWFLEVIRLACADHPAIEVTAILDCADQPGRALGALRLGVKVLRLDGNPRARRRVGAIAAAMGARLDDTRFEVLDLAGSADARAAVTAFLTNRILHPARRRLSAAPQDDAFLLSASPPRHPEEGPTRSGGPVSKDEKLRRRCTPRTKRT